MQIDLVSQLIASSSSSPEIKEVMSSAQSLVHEYIAMAKERDEWWASSLKREQKRQTIWEESLQTVVKEGEALERELKERSRRRGSRFFAAGVSEASEGSAMSTLRLHHRPPTIALSAPVEEESAHDVRLGGDDDTGANGMKANDHFRQSASSFTSATHTTTTAVSSSSGMDTPTPTGVMDIPTPRARKSQNFLSPPATATLPADDGGDTDEEDEFFDAVEAENLPNLIVNESLSRHNKELASNAIDGAPYAGYRKFRTRLAMDTDNRPATSLWAVLKGSIGKDLTRVCAMLFITGMNSNFFVLV
jgi:oxysterol-binding protein 1